MGQHKDKAIKRSQAQDAAARAAGRVCVLCGGTIDFDDLEADLRGDGLCSSCRHKLSES